MSHPHTTTLTRPASLAPGAGLAPRPGLLTRLVDLALDWSERARARHQLAALTEGELKDIGLSRADVSMETSKPFWRF